MYNTKGIFTSIESVIIFFAIFATIFIILYLLSREKKTKKMSGVSGEFWYTKWKGVKNEYM